MKIIFAGARREGRILVLESWALFGKDKVGISALKELEKLQVDDLIFENIHSKAKSKEVRDFANEILIKRNTLLIKKRKMLFETLQKDIKKRIGVDLKKAKDLIDKKQANP